MIGIRRRVQRDRAEETGVLRLIEDLKASIAELNVCISECEDVLTVAV